MLCYQCLPLLYDKLFPTTVIVVAHLKARTTRRHTLLHSFRKRLMLICSVNNYVMTQLTQWPALSTPSFFYKRGKGSAWTRLSVGCGEVGGACYSYSCPGIGWVGPACSSYSVGWVGPACSDCPGVSWDEVGVACLL